MHKALLAAAVLVAACGPPRSDPTAVGAVFDSLYARFSEGYRTADPTAVAALYADSAWYLQPGDSIVRGRAAIEAGFAGFLLPFRRAAEGGPVIEFEVVDRQVAASGDLATDIGYYLINGRSRGKFVVIWVKDAAGRWRMHADGYSAAPPPAGGAP